MIRPTRGLSRSSCSALAVARHLVEGRMCASTLMVITLVDVPMRAKTRLDCSSLAGYLLVRNLNEPGVRKVRKGCVS